MEEKALNPLSSTVLIVGAGPTGMTAALELSRLQIPVRIIEKLAEPSKTSKAVGVQARTLELFEQRGVIESMLQKGNRSLGGCFYSQGKRIIQLEFSHNSSDYGYILLIPQAETEAILCAALEKQGVTIEREVEFVALSQSDPDRSAAVKAILKHRDGSLEDFNCAYLISTEGAHSTTRTTLNLPFEGKTRVESYALGELYVESDLSETNFHTFSSEFGFMGLLPMGGGLFRIMANNPLSEPSKDTSPSLEELQKIYDQRSHIPARFYDMKWGSWYRINSRMVERLRVGRVLLGGDSAHIHSPIGGQGMNTGIQDMVNLAWKLAFVMKGQADPTLLDTYTDDRVPVIRDVLTNTDGLTDAFGSQSKVFRTAFTLIAPWVASRQFFQDQASERLSQLALNYRHSPLSVSHGAVRAQLKAGDRLPNVKVLIIGGEGEGTHEIKSKPENLFHVLSINRFTLLFADLTNAEATHQSAQSSLATWKPLMQTYNVAAAPGQEQAFRSVFGSKSSLMLVRPDGYVAFAGTEQSLEALARYLNTWFPTEKQTD